MHRSERPAPVRIGPHPRVDEVLRQHGAQCDGAAADGRLALFGARASFGDDALRAARACRAIVEDFRAGDASVRIGISTGPVSTAADGGPRTQDLASRAAELAAAAGPNEILVDNETASQIRTHLLVEPAHADSLARTVFRVAGDTGGRTGADAAARRLTRYVGREAELTTLLDAVEASTSGEGEVIVVCGEPGIGKSRLLHELKQRIGADPAIALVQGRCHAYAATPYQPFVDVVRDRLQISAVNLATLDSADVSAAIVSIDHRLQPMVPLYLRILSPGNGQPPVGAHANAPELPIEIADALAAFIAASADQRTTVLLLEDWHWADAASSEVLRQIAGLAASIGLLVVVTSREPEVAAADAAARLRLLRLGTLPRGATAALTADMCAADAASEALIGLVFERSGGNPFFAEELCRLMRDEHSVRVANRIADLDPASPCNAKPHSVQALIRMRIDRLQGAPRGILRAASVLGREFTRQLLERTLVHASALREALDVLSASGLIQQTRAVPQAEYRFRHILTQEVAYETLLPQQRQALHLAAARAIEATHAGPIEDQAERLTHHYSAAGAWAEAVGWAQTAARKSLALGRFGDAHAMLGRALTWTEGLPESACNASTAADLLLLYERACEMLGARDEQQRVIDRLLALIEPASDRGRLAETLLRQGELLVLTGDFDAALDALRRSLEHRRALGDAAGERNVLVSLGFCLWQRGCHVDAIAANEAALAIDRHSGVPERIGTTLTNLGSIYRSLHDHRRALECLEESRAELRRAGWSARAVGYTLQIIANVHRDMGDRDAAMRQLQEALTWEIDNHALIQQAFTLCSMASVLIEERRIPEALQHLERSLVICRTAHYAHGGLHALQMIVQLVLDDRPQDAIPYVAEAVDLAQRLGHTTAAACLQRHLAEALGRNSHLSEAALAAWGRARQLSAEQGDVSGELLAAQGQARVTRFLCRNPVAAETLYVEALDLARRSTDRSAEGDLLNTLAILAWARGEDDEAIARYAEARRCLADDPPNLAIVLNGLAVCLLRRGDARNAIEVARDAASCARAAGREVLEAYAMATEGDAHSAVGAHANARSCYSASLELRRRIDDRRGEGWMLHRLSKSARSVGDVGEAVAWARDAAMAASASGDAALIEACRTLSLY